MLANLATFLELEPIEAWIHNALVAMKTKEGDNHSDSFIAFYQQSVTNKFAQLPNFLANLVVFTVQKCFLTAHSRSQS
ncbi:MAG: hypothetical protein HC890_11405 [Chloroflexaceae bacterium]|nr:hypothetical protein [Chloroflexaceae bacterium]